MKRFYIPLICILVFSILSQPVNVSSDAAARVIFSKYNIDNAQWTNVSIGPFGYSIDSDNELYDQLDNEFINSPWKLIEEKFLEENFFNLDILEIDPKNVLQIDYIDDSHTVAFDEDVSQIEGLLGILNNIFQRAIGDFQNEYYWPTDLIIDVMESYPEQYGVTTRIQMANGLFSLVYDENATLIVSDYDITANYLADPNGNISYITSENFTIAISGDIAEISFKTFSIGVDSRPADLFFLVVLENGMYLKSSIQDIFPIIGHSDADFSEFQQISQTSSSNFLEMPVQNIWLLLPIMAISIISRVYRSNKHTLPKR